MMLKNAFLFASFLMLFAFSAFAQVPDPRDSVILESKMLDTSLIGSPAFFLKVYITNKDSVNYFNLPLTEETTLGGAYMILSHPRTFSGVVTPLTFSLRFHTGANYSRYNSSSADSFFVGGGFDSVDLTTIEPPNNLRKPIWQLKFDTVLAACGQAVLDSAFLPPDTSVGFVNTAGTKVKVNFVPAKLFVCSGDTFPTSFNEDGSNRLTSVCKLSQNYPNPFNANTQITFALPKSGRATLEVFNVLGQKVSTLVDGYLTAGTKIVNWDGRDNRGKPVPSGIYFYQLRSGDFIEKKKMVFLK